MKRIRLLVLLGAVAVALPLGLTTAKATGGSPSTYVSINEDAQYDLNGNIIHIGMQVRCKKGTVPPLQTTGEVQGSASQSPPQTPYPVGTGIGLNGVVCDGNTHAAALSIQGEGFDAGRAKATVKLVPPVGGGSSVSTTETINIVVMNR